MIDYQLDADGIVTLTWNVPGRSQNLMNRASCDAFGEAVARALAEPNLKGVLIASAKSDFIAGGDLEDLLCVTDPQAMFERLLRLDEVLRRLETCGKPVAAAMPGAALGGGLEVALACHYRVAADNPKARFGLPEATLGLLPGAGGTQRLPRLIGIQKALPLLLEGARLTPADALKMGILDAIAPAGEEIRVAREWLLGAGQENAAQPWDVKGYKVPGGPMQSPSNLQALMAGNAMLSAKTYNNYPALNYIMSCVYEGMQTDYDTAQKTEARYFVKAVTSPEAKNLIQTMFFSLNAANKLADRPRDVPTQTFKKIGILGAGMMGAGIAYVSAKAGQDVVLLDTSIEGARKGKSYSENLVGKRVGKGRMSASEAQALLARITPTPDFADLAGADIVIEAVFEDRAIKADVTKKSEAAIPPKTIFASNTSSLPITGLAEASVRPENFIGLHFFSPVDKMPLVEVIIGQKTSQETLARALDYVRSLGKTPIIVNDSRGFYTTRVFATYLDEGMSLLAEGVAPALIDNAGRIAGMPVGPLALCDEVSIELAYKVIQQTKADLGAAYQSKPSDAVVELMVAKLGRLGRKAGKGFYDYPEDGQKHLWPGLAEHFPHAAEQRDLQEVVLRLILIQCVEATRCFAEGVITSARDADVGSVLGWGFPPFRGGAIQQIRSMGLETFKTDCGKLAEKYGVRFRLPDFCNDPKQTAEIFGR